MKKVCFCVIIGVSVEINPQVFHCKYKGFWPIADLYCSSRTMHLRVTQIIPPRPHENEVADGVSIFIKGNQDTPSL